MKFLLPLSVNPINIAHTSLATKIFVLSCNKYGEFVSDFKTSPGDSF